MVFKVILSELALHDLSEIVSYIGPHDEEAARRYCQNLLDCTEKLAENPNIGNSCVEFGDPFVRNLVYRNHRIIYRVDLERKLIVVSRFWHGARGYFSNDEL